MSTRRFAVFLAGAMLALLLSMALAGCDLSKLENLQYEVVPLDTHVRPVHVEYVRFGNCDSDAIMERSGEKTAEVERSLELKQVEGPSLEIGGTLFQAVYGGIQTKLENHYGFKMNEKLTDLEKWRVEVPPHLYAIVSLSWSEQVESGYVHLYKDDLKVGTAKYEMTTDIILSDTKPETYSCEDERLIERLLEICDQYLDIESVSEARNCYESVLNLSPGNRRAELVLSGLSVAAIQTAAAPPTATPTVLPEPTKTKTPIPPTPTPVPPTPTPPSCAFTPGGAFAGIWQAYKDRLGCPYYPTEKEVSIVEEQFERGHMFWRSDARRIYVVYDGEGWWQDFQDTWTAGVDPERGGHNPPPGLHEPVRGFGKVWREQLGGSNAHIGWALGPEAAFTDLIQDFRGGVILKDSDGIHTTGLAYVLF